MVKDGRNDRNELGVSVCSAGVREHDFQNLKHLLLNLHTMKNETAGNIVNASLVPKNKREHDCHI